MRRIVLSLFFVGVGLANPFVKVEDKPNNVIPTNIPSERNVEIPSFQSNLPPPNFPLPSGIPSFPADIPPPNIARQEEKAKVYGYINGYTMIEKNKDILLIADKKCYIVYPDVPCEKEKVKEEVKIKERPKRK